MTRLTISLKEKIVDAAIEQSGINKLRSEVISKRASLAENMRIDKIGGKDEEASLIRLAKKIIKQQTAFENIRGSNFGFHSSTALVYCNLGGSRVHLYFNGQVKGSGKSVHKKIIPDDIVYTADHKFTVEFHSIEKLSKMAESKASEVSAQVRSSLDSFTTVKKLLEAWPEAKELLPKKVEESKPLLPAVQVKDLNKLIGLPKGEK